MSASVPEPKAKPFLQKNGDDKMDHKRIISGAMALTIAAAMAGCASSDKNDKSEKEPTTAASTAPSTEESTEPTTEPEPPHPADCNDPNAITFDDGDFSFASVNEDDVDSAKGTLEIAEVEGNKMLRFKDSGTNFADGTVQKIKLDAVKLLAPENLAKVRSIEFDAYADATAEDYKNDDGEKLRAPGWIGGGGGANTAADTWAEFEEWSGGEYNFEMSGAVHVKFKFLLADSGECWDDTMEEAVMQIMRWGAQNEGNFYIDNILFLDADGKSLPIEKKSEPAAEPAKEEAPATEGAEAPATEPDSVEKAVDAGIAEAEKKLEEAQKKADEAIAEASKQIEDKR